MKKTDLLMHLFAMPAREILRAGLLATLLAGLVLGCGSGGGGFAANGGMSGSGISQGAITGFGSIFVNGVEWEIDEADIELDGLVGDETDLRVGMVVRVEGDLSQTGTTGSAISVIFDDELEGPISDDPVSNPEGTRKQFTVLDTTVIVDVNGTVFDDGASFDGLARDQVVEVSGFVDELGAVRATRVELEGTFPGQSEVELRGTVSNPVPDAMNGGIFELGSITVRYTAGTLFEDGTRQDLVNGATVEVEGTLRVTGDEVDALVIEFEDEGLDEDFEDFEIEGFVTSYVSDASFVVAGIPVDASAASFEPTSLMLANGVQVEVDGRLEAGILIADEVEAEGDDDPDGDEDTVEIRAAASQVATNPNEITILGVVVSVDAETRLKDERDELPNFRFTDIQAGDWLEIKAVPTGAGTARAREVDREDADADVVFQGPITDLDTVTPSLEILGQPIPLDGMTQYFDENDQSRSEDEFFRNPGDVSLGDVVKVKDESAADPELLGEADEVEIED